MDKFINATRLIGILDSALACPRDRGNAKSIGNMVMQCTKLILEKEISAGGEFRRVVHAHWIEHEADFGESLYCECSSCHDSTGIDCTRFCGACGAIMNEQTIKVQDC
jgi:hypothetical protein